MKDNKKINNDKGEPLNIIIEGVPQNTIEASERTVKCEDCSEDAATLDSARARVKREFDKLMLIYKKAYTEISNVQFRHNKLIEQQELYKTIFKEQLDIVKAEAKSVFEQIVWDHLVIGFFGETNAGKSTIIEALRLMYAATPDNHVPGDIIGNGKVDFTKEASEYYLNIDGHHVTLIDVPGIEGDEAKFSDIIKRALSKAHLIFYVQGKNKKPDSKIAAKIKDYLADWSRVYTIYNVRGNIGGYEDEEVLDTILTKKNLEVQEQISEVFRVSLKKSYNDIITLQGHLAVSVCNDFANDEKKHKNFVNACRIFGSADKALEYSNFMSLVLLLKSCIADVSDNIYKSNVQKIIGLRKKGVAVITRIEKKQFYQIQNLREAFDKLRRGISADSTEGARNIKTGYKRIIDNEFRRAVEEIYAIIDNDDFSVDKKKSECAKFQYLLPQRISDAITTSVRNICNRMTCKISTKIQEFQKLHLSLPITVDIEDFNLNLDLEYNLKDLDVNFKDVVDVVGTIAKYAGIGAFGGVPGALIGFGLGIFKAVYDSIVGDGGRGEAKNKIKEELDVCRGEAIRNVHIPIDCVLQQMERQRKFIDAKILAEMKSLDDIEDIISQLSHKLKYISKEEY